MEIVTSFSDSPFLWFFANMFAVIPNIFAAVSQPELWLDWLSWDNTKEDKPDKTTKTRKTNTAMHAFSCSGSIFSSSQQR